MVPFRLISCHPESCSVAAYRCNPGTAAWAAELGGCEPKPTTISAYPSQSLSRAPACPPPSPGFPSPLLWCGLERKLRALQGSAARIWEGVGRGQGFPLESVASLAPGKLFKVPSSACPGRLRRARRQQERQPRHRRHLCRYCRQQRALGG